MLIGSLLLGPRPLLALLFPDASEPLSREPCPILMRQDPCTGFVGFGWEACDSPLITVSSYAERLEEVVLLQNLAPRLVGVGEPDQFANLRVLEGNPDRIRDLHEDPTEAELLMLDVVSLARRRVCSLYSGGIDASLPLLDIGVLLLS